MCERFFYRTRICLRPKHGCLCITSLDTVHVKHFIYMINLFLTYLCIFHTYTKIRTSFVFWPSISSCLCIIMDKGTWAVVNIHKGTCQTRSKKGMYHSYLSTTKKEKRVCIFRSFDNTSTNMSNNCLR